MSVFVLSFGVLLIILGTIGFRRRDELVPALSDPAEHEHRRRVIRRGTVTFQVVGALFVVAGVLALTG